MCFDERRKRLYVLGRHGERGYAALSDFYYYDILAAAWTRLSRDTLSSDGPPLLYDHAMCIAPDAQKLYVFGGVVVPQDKLAGKAYGGLYCYDVVHNTWSRIRADGDLDRSIALFYGREGAAMCAHADGRLYIVGGQRHGEWQADGLLYEPSTDTFTTFATPKEGIYLAAGLLSEQRSELFVYGGVVKRESGAPTAETSVLRSLVLEHAEWTELPVARSAFDTAVPPPRYSSALCYDASIRAFYVFGGAASTPSFHTLGDLWIGRLQPAPRATLMSRIRILLRTRRCAELMQLAPRAADEYFDTMLSPLLDVPIDKTSLPRHSIMARARLYREILAMLPRSCFMQPHERLARMQKAASFDWNSAFQDLLEHPVRNAHDEREKYTKLHRLTNAFVQAARPIAEQLILDSFLAASRKLFKSSDLGGRAGGQKFVVGRIFFKFAVDSFGYYGGDQNAAKAAGHEHKALTELLSYQNHKLHVPLFALFTLHGKRLLAASVLPISRASLVYGSNDGGRNVHDDHAEMRNQMTLVGAHLNLKPHQIRNTGKWLIMPGDIEGHLSEEDGRLYVIDAARMFPPSAPVGGRRVSLYNLLRPELVRQNPVALSSDAFYRWGDPDNQMLHNKDVEQATVRLLRVVVPSFAATLTDAVEADALVALLHQHGINLRCLGLVHAHCASVAARSALLREMVARTWKCHFHDQLRTMRIDSEQDFAHRAVLLFNTLFAAPEAKESAVFWLELGRQLRRKYQVPLDPAHCITALEGSGRQLLYVRLQQLTGVLFRVSHPPSHAQPFSFRALKALVPIVKAVKLPPALSLEQYEAQYAAELRARETALGTTGHPALINLLLNMARVARWKGNEEEARGFTQRALTISLREAGVDEERLLEMQRLVLQVSGIVQQSRARQPPPSSPTKGLSPRSPHAAWP